MSDPQNGHANPAHDDGDARIGPLARRIEGRDREPHEYYILVTIAAVAFVWFLNQWNLLGWQF